jgi:hypothetical protein
MYLFKPYCRLFVPNSGSIKHLGGMMPFNSVSPNINHRRSFMKKILLALALAVGALSAAAPTYAAPDYHHHHRDWRHRHYHHHYYHHHLVCRNWREHGHWVRRCR